MGHPFVARRWRRTCTENTPYRLGTHTSSLQYFNCRHTERPQYLDSIYRRCRLRLDSRYAIPATRISRTDYTPAIKNRRPRTNHHVIPSIRPHVLHRRHRRGRNLPVPSIRQSRRKGRYRPPTCLPRPRSPDHVNRLPPRKRSSRPRRPNDQF